MANEGDLFDLSGRHALVTGASRGIGLAIAQGLAERGASVVITGRKPDTLTVAAERLRKSGANVQSVVCHQGDPSAITRLFDEFDRMGHAPEIVVVNAATNPVMGALLQTELAAWQKILEVNLTGALVTAQQAARRMVPRKKGSLIFMASIAGLDPMPAIPAYSVSKAGLIGLTKALAKELGPAGIRVNAIAPGLVETKFAAALFQDKPGYERLMAGVPLQRHGQPEDIVGTAIFLASDASAYVTGQVLVVDGGARM
jgi:NAD(P)-dependent dehydrogenase (short-subunit alcohol dehydrogenase family)